MKKSIIKCLYATLLLGAAAAMQSCNCKDVTNPDVDWAKEHTNPILVGTVASERGLMEGVTVSVDINGTIYTAVTDADGFYAIYNLEEGTFQAVCDVDNGVTYAVKTEPVVLAEDKITVWNVYLMHYISGEFEINGEDQEFSVNLPGIESEDTIAEEQFATMKVKANSLEEGDYLKLKATYDYANPVGMFVTKAPAGFRPMEKFAVVVVDASAASGASTTKKPITVIVDDLDDPVYVKHNGKDVDFKRYYDEDGVRHTMFETSELGVSEFYYRIYKGNERHSQTRIAVTPDQFPGRVDMVEAEFQYIYGSDVKYSHTLFDHYIGLLEGAISKDIEHVHVRLAKEVPAGEVLILNAYQTVDSYTYLYGDVTIDVDHYSSILLEYQDRMHTGGSSK